MDTKVSLANVLAERYASPDLVKIWAPENKVVLERQLWVAVLRAQKKQGLANITNEAIWAYESSIKEVDLESIRQRELVTRQDVKARIEIFNKLAGCQLCHVGMTSRDPTDNVEQMQVRDSLKLCRVKIVAVLARFGKRAQEYRALDMCGRSHNVPGQTITLGHRFAMWAQELLLAFDHLEYLIYTYPLRGIKGPMGTQQDQVDLLGDMEKAKALEQDIMKYLGFNRVLDCVGQVYPRSLDFAVASVLLQLASAMGNFATTLRLMAGNELAHEGFKEGQTGSTAMPHKVNSRTCERICGLVDVLGGYVDMTSRLVGNQWNEGDVSCSVPRRVVLPDAFFAFDGICESALTVLDELQIFPAVIEAELARFLPLLSTTRLLVEAVKKGWGREKAHVIIKRCALLVVDRMRSGHAAPNLFLEELSGDSEFPLDRFEIKGIIETPNHGASLSQIDQIDGQITMIAAKYPEAAAYKPQPIL